MGKLKNDLKHFNGSATSHLGLNIWVGRLVGLFQHIFQNKQSLSKLSSLLLLDSLLILHHGPSSFLMHGAWCKEDTLKKEDNFKHEDDLKNEDHHKNEDDLKTEEDIKNENKLNKNDHNGGIWQSGISKSLVEYVQHRVCFVNVHSSFHLNVVFFSLWVHGQCRVHHIYHVEFHFRFRRLVSFPV